MHTALQLDSLSIAVALRALVMGSMWWSCIAFLGVALFGTAVCYGLWWIGRFSLLALMLCPTLPAVMVALFKKDLGVSAMMGYYSLAVCVASGFAGLRHVSTQCNSIHKHCNSF